MLGEQLSPPNGISGQLISNIFDLFFRYISWCLVFICQWGGSEVMGSEGDRIRLNLSPCLWPDRSGRVFRHSWLCFICLNVLVLMVWYGESQANSNSPERNKLRFCFFSAVKASTLGRLETDRVKASWLGSLYCSSSDIPRHLEIRLHVVCAYCETDCFPSTLYHLACWWKIVWYSCWVIFILEGRALILRHMKNMWVVSVLDSVLSHFQTRSQMLDLGGHTHRDVAQCMFTVSRLLTKYCFWF